MKIAILGGAFNPIHLGHLALADDVCIELGYDRIIFVPSYISPHKEIKNPLSAQKRLAMVKKACAKDKRFFVEDCEIKRQGTSYTYDTISFLEKKYKNLLDDKIGIIMGEDLHKTFHLWYKAEELAQKCTLILAQRPVSSVSSHFKNVPKQEYKNATDCGSEELFRNAVRINNPLISISSSEIRERAALFKSFKYLVPESVFKYITKGNLYGYTQSPTS